MSQLKNLGILIGRKDTDYIAGSTNSLPFNIVNSSGDWSQYEPPTENQYSNNVDSAACVSYSAVHCIETQIKYLTGKTLDLSERFLAKLSNTTPSGNYQNVVAETIRKYGLVLQEDWPVPDNFTWDTYYSEIPQNIIDKGKLFFQQWNFGYEFVNAQDVDKNLQQAPLQIVIDAVTPYHAVELVNKTTYFDSYAPYNKKVDTVHDYFKLLVTSKNMFKLVQVQGSPEVWLVKDGKKTHIYNQGALLSISDFSQITLITQNELDATPDSGLELATLVRE